MALDESDGAVGLDFRCLALMACGSAARAFCALALEQVDSFMQWPLLKTCATESPPISVCRRSNGAASFAVDGAINIVHHIMVFFDLFFFPLILRTYATRRSTQTSV